MSTLNDTRKKVNFQINILFDLMDIMICIFHTIKDRARWFVARLGKVQYL